MKKMIQICLLTLAATSVLYGCSEIPSAVGDCEFGKWFETRTPSRDFELLENGSVVRDKFTGLEWRRCPEGMRWNGYDCDGSAIRMTWQEAVKHADRTPGWYLPDTLDLIMIVETCRTAPAINRKVFPSSPSYYFWTNWKVLSKASYVSFIDGEIGDGSLNEGRYVRFVRGLSYLDIMAR